MSPPLLWCPPRQSHQGLHRASYRPPSLKWKSYVVAGSCPRQPALARRLPPRSWARGEDEFPGLDDKTQATTQTCFGQRRLRYNQISLNFHSHFLYAFLPLVVRHAIYNSLSLTDSLAIIPLAPALPPPAGARTSCPWHDTSRWQWTAQRGPAPPGLSWYIACPDRGGSGPRAGACRVPRPGRGPLGSDVRLTRSPEGPAEQRSLRGAAGPTPRIPTPYGHGRGRGHAQRVAPPPACGRPADRPRSHSPPAMTDRLLTRSRHLSAPPAPAAARPRQHGRQRHTHSPGPRRSRGTRSACYKLGRAQGSVRARGWPWRGPSYGGRKNRHRHMHGEGCLGDRP